MDAPLTMFVMLSPRKVGGLCVLPLALIGAAAQAQNTQAPVTVPGLDGYSLPAQPERPTPLQTPEPRIAPLPRPTPTATPTAAATPASPPSPVTIAPPVRTTARPTPEARSTPTPTPSVTPTPSATPTPVGTPAIVGATPAPKPTVVTAPSPRPAQQASTLGWWVAGAGLVALLAGLWLYRRPRRVERDDETATPLPPRAPEPRLAPPPPPPPVVTPRPRIEIDLEVKRAGTNLLSAAVEYRLMLRNVGDADARGIALDLRLFGVDPRLEPALAALFDTPLDRPVVARFDLAAGTTAALEGTAMAPREAMPPLPIRSADEAGGRVLFVPVLAVNLHYGWMDGAGQSAASFVVGIDRGADTKLAPFRLDGAPRMHDRIRLMPFTARRST